MKTITVRKENKKNSVSGSGTFEIKNQIKKYGFKFSWEKKSWIGTDEMVEILENYISNFKSSKIEIIK